MSTHSLRIRYLTALGISGSMLSACSSTEPRDTTATADSTATATSEPSASTVASATPVEAAATATTTAAATAASAAFWEPTVGAPATSLAARPNVRPLPSCENGVFCVSEAKATGSVQVAAPFASCAVKIDDPQNPGSRTRSIHFDRAQTERERSKIKDACCYGWVVPCPGGRPLLVDGEPRVAAPAASSAWLCDRACTSLDAVLGVLDERDRHALAQHYATEAAYEHASVAAFARVSLALLAHGAPADLVADTHRAALDEVRHAEAMYTVASAYAGEPLGPAALSLEGATLGASLTDLAREALTEGCAGEVAAALVLREEGERAVDEAMRGRLTMLADDEERHAELAFRTVAWALFRDRSAVGPALAAACAELERELTREPPPVERALPFITSARERLLIRRRALAEIVLPCIHALLSSAPDTRSTLHLRGSA